MYSAIEITHLSKSFGNQLVLNNVNINVPQGSVYGFLGNNGAGKSTLIRILLGLITMNSGQIKIDSKKICRKDIAYKQNIGCIIDSPCLYLHLTPREQLGITCKLKNLSKKDINRVLEIVTMENHIDKKMDSFSLGMKQRIGIANSLIGNPKLLILDEPTNGLDPSGMKEIRLLLSQLPERSGATVFLSSHLLDEIEKTASHVGLLHHGKILVESSLENLRKQSSGSLDIRTNDIKKLQAFAKSNEKSTQVISSDTLRFSRIDLQECSYLNKAIIDANIQLIESNYNTFSLEKYFLKLVKNTK